MTSSIPMTTTPFRFMDLPGEIRNHIYNDILCAFELPEEGENGPFIAVSNNIAIVHRNIDTAILRTNRQIYQEAKVVMLKTNQFIRVETHGVDLSRVLISKQVPIISMDRNFVSNFKGFVMSHHVKITSVENPFNPYFDFMILRRDLDVSARAVADADISIPGFTLQTVHLITLHNPVEDADTEYPSLKQQEHLLSPYRKQLRGFPHVRVEGKVSKDLAQAVVAEVKVPPFEDPKKILEELQQQKELGNQYFREGNSKMCSETWTQGCMQIHRLRNGSSWPQVKRTGGVEFVDKLAELMFLLSLNRAQNTIKVMQENTNDPDVLEGLSNSALHALDGATGAPDLLGSDWAPSRQQVAKLFYREALTHRLVGRRVHLVEAERAINIANQAWPGDAQIMREKEEIARWRARVFARQVDPFPEAPAWEDFEEDFD